MGEASFEFSLVAKLTQFVTLVRYLLQSAQDYKQHQHHLQ